MDAKQQTSGVQNLIDRLREQGVAQGQKQAAEMLDESRARATHVVEQAMAKAEQLKKEAAEEAERSRQATEAALKLAVRDASLKLREEIYDRFAKELSNMVRKDLADPAFLQNLLTEVVKSAVPGGEGNMKVLLPSSVLSVEDLEKNPEELQNGSLSKFAVTLAKEALTKGIEIAPASDNRAGLRFEWDNGQVRVDASEQAITQLLLKHLMPRFRALVAGMI